MENICFICETKTSYLICNSCFNKIKDEINEKLNTITSNSEEYFFCKYNTNIKNIQLFLEKKFLYNNSEDVELFEEVNNFLN